MCASCDPTSSSAHTPSAEAHAEQSRVSFAALRNRDFRTFTGAGTLWMMADNIEHVISYWVLFELFNSQVLAGYAVISHWAPVLFFSVYAGALSDRFDNRKLTIFSMVLFMSVSIAWGMLFWTDSLQMWHAVVLLTIHGLAGTFFQPARQLMIHDIVGPSQLQSGVRITSTSTQLGIFLGPVVGSALLIYLGPALGIFVNALIYVPMIVWCLRVPYTGHLHRGTTSRPPVRLGLGSYIDAIRVASRNRVILSMIALGGMSSFFIGNAYQAHMPEFALQFLPTDEGFLYATLLAASAAGAVLGGLAMESVAAFQPRPRTAIALACVWALTMLSFAAAPHFGVALAALFIAGIFQISFTSMAQTIVQLEAPAAERGRTIGVFAMSLNGLRLGSGFTVGFIGAAIGINFSLGLSSVLLFVLTLLLLAVVRSAMRPRPALAAD